MERLSLFTFTSPISYLPSIVLTYFKATGRRITDTYRVCVTASKRLRGPKNTVLIGNKNLSLSVAAVQSFSDVTATFWPQEGSKDKATRTKSHQIPSRPQKQVETLAAIVSCIDITATVINLQLRCTATADAKS